MQKSIKIKEEEKGDREGGRKSEIQSVDKNIDFNQLYLI